MRTGYTVRVLPRAEWPRLAGTEADRVWRTLTSDADVLVVEHDGEIVGCWTLFAVLHAECFWTAPTERGRPQVLYRLWAGMKRLIRARGVTAVCTSAVTDDVRALLWRYGAAKVPGDQYVLSIEGDR